AASDVALGDPAGRAATLVDDQVERAGRFRRVGLPGVDPPPQRDGEAADRAPAAGMRHGRLHPEALVDGDGEVGVVLDAHGCPPCGAARKWSRRVPVAGYAPE